MRHVITFARAQTSIGHEVNEMEVLSPHSTFPLWIVLVVELSLLHPYDTGNYIVREESENVPMKLIEDSDERDDRTDDHRNV